MEKRNPKASLACGCAIEVVAQAILPWRLPSLVKSDAAHQVRKTRVTEERIKEGMHLDVLQNS